MPIQLMVLLALLVLAIPARAIFRAYLRRRLFLEPWVNLTRDEEFAIGGGVAELLLFEIERIHRLLHRAARAGGLWNEKLLLPSMERTSDGYTRLVHDVELLGLPSRVTRLVQFVVNAKPRALQGSIQRYGDRLRFQLRLTGTRRTQTPPVTSWATTIRADEPDRVPEAVADLAHQVMRDLAGIQGFKTPEAFRAFTSALAHHIDFANVSRSHSLEAALQHYRMAIEHDGSNALAACNLADLLYVQFTFESNELAIEGFTNALNTDNLGLRARAYRGLANALCQKYQRYRRRDRAVLDNAVWAARKANDLCTEVAMMLTDNEVASIKKAAAYAQQVSAEQPGLSASGREEKVAFAATLYREAIQRDGMFSAAYNNLAYLHLEKAKTLYRSEPDYVQRNERITEQIRHCLEDASNYCAGAIRTDRRLYVAYDNRGNIARLEAAILTTRAEELLESAIDSYREALSYHPTYSAAFNDLAKAYVQLNALGLSREEEGAELAWHYHWEALRHTDDELSRHGLCDDFAKRPRPRPLASVDRRAERCTCYSRGVLQ
ncbi:MAG: hypothetical protein AB7N65_11420 [Vicinamibacterales bacterium]